MEMDILNFRQKKLTKGLNFLTFKDGDLKKKKLKIPKLHNI